MSRGTEGAAAPSNPMPPLSPEVREALTDSIREHGVVVPVVKDQTGYVLDGYNRIEIAATLGVTVPETVFTCDPERRDVLRIELNGARRQLTDEQWKPLVDHLRTQGHADRAIAQAVGVDRNRVQRYKSPVTTTDSSESVVTPDAKPKVETKIDQDGKRRVVHTKGSKSARDRVLELLQKSTTGLTAPELLLDPFCKSNFSESTVLAVPSALRDQGLIEEAGKRGRATVWRAVKPAAPTPPPTPSGNPVLRRRAEKALSILTDPKTIAEVRALIDDGKQQRKLERLVRQVEKENEAVRLEQERRQADIDREELRLAEIARDSVHKSVRYWDKLADALDGATKVLALLVREYDHFPAITQVELRVVYRKLDELRAQQDRLEKLLRRRGSERNPIGNDVIDV